MKETDNIWHRCLQKPLSAKNTSQIVQNSCWFVVLKHYMLWKSFWQQRGMFHCGLFKYYSSLSFSSLLYSVHPLSHHPSAPSSFHFVFDCTVHPSSQYLPSISFHSLKEGKDFKAQPFLKMHVFSGFNIVSMV